MNTQSAPLKHEDTDRLLPLEVELFIEADGSVVLADLAAEVISLAQGLNPDQPLICDVSQGGGLHDRRIP